MLGKLNSTTRVLTALLLALPFPACLSAAGPAPVDLRSTANFVILSGAGITTTGGGLITGNLGASPITGAAIGVTCAQLSGIMFAVDAAGPPCAVVNAGLLTTAKGDLTTAYNDAAARTPVPTGGFLNPNGGNIGGLTLVPGLYKFTTTALITGADVTLSGGADDVWIFQCTQDLQLGSGVKIILAGGALANNVFWQVGSSAVLGTGSVFKGTILAEQSVTMATSSALEGRALAFSAGVVFNGSTAKVSTVPAPTITSVTGPSAGAYRAGQNLSFTVNFSAAVSVDTASGTPTLPLTVGAASVNASYVSGSPGTALIFTYTVQAGDTDADGIASASPLVLNGGTIKGSGGTAAVLTFTPPDTTAVLVDTTAPTIAISAPSVSDTTIGPVTFLVAYADGNFNASTLAVGDLTLNKSGTANGTVTVDGATGTARVVTISRITGSGTLGITIGAGTASDVAGNLAPATGASATFTVTPPNVAPSFTLRAVTGPQGAWTVTTIAGLSGSSGSTDDAGAAARFNQPFGMAVDAAGNLYVADRFNHTIRKMTPSGVVTTLAGLAGSSGGADGTGAAARFNGPVGVAVDGAGNVYVGDTGNQTIRKITAGGVVTTLAGLAGNSGGADGTGTGARFNGPAGVAVDGAGNVSVADSNNRMIRKVTAGGVVTTLAGLAGNSGSADGTGAAARFLYPFGVAVDVGGNVFVADLSNHTLRKVTPAGVVTTVAGLAGSSGSIDGTGSAARFNQPTAVTADEAGNVYVVDGINHTVRKVTPGGVVTTIAGLAGTSGSTDGVGAAARFSKPYGIAVDHAGNLFLAETYYFTVRKLTPGTPSAANLTAREDASAQEFEQYVRDLSPGPANESGQTVSFSISNDNPGLFAVPPTLDAAGKLNYTPAANASGSALVTIVAMDNGGTANGGVDKSTNTFTLTVVSVNDAPTIAFAGPEVRVFRNSCPFSAAFVTITTGPANESGQSITGVSVNNDNPGLFAAQPTLTGCVLSFTPAAHAIGVATVTVTAQDNGGTANGGIDRTSQSFTVTVQAVNEAPRFALQVGTVQGPWTATTVTGTALSVGATDGTGAAARFNNPFGIVQDNAGNVYVSDRVNHTIRQLTPAGVVTTLAGSAGVAGSADGIEAAARFNAPAGLAVDAADNVYVADSNNRTVRMITPGGAVTTLAGSAGVAGSADGIGAAARFLYPFGLAVDRDGNAYVSDAGNRTIRKISRCGMVTTLAGLAGNLGATDGTGAAARFALPYGLAVDDAGTLFVADQASHTIRRLTAAGVVTTLAGTAASAGVADGTGAAARFNKPTAVAVDHAGNLYVVDGDNHTLRRIAAGGVVTTLAGSPGVTGFSDGTGSGARFRRPYGVIVDHTGNLLLADTGNHTVREVAPVSASTPRLVIAASAGAQTIAGFASGIVAGPADEAGQTVSFGVATDRAALFTGAPAIDNAGTLTFTPAAGTSGMAVVTVQAQDNGGTANGGVNTSVARSFLITITP